jgi:hypothetical protein
MINPASRTEPMIERPAPSAGHLRIAMRNWWCAHARACRTVQDG